MSKRGGVRERGEKREKSVLLSLHLLGGVILFFVSNEQTSKLLTTVRKTTVIHGCISNSALSKCLYIISILYALYLHTFLFCRNGI